ACAKLEHHPFRNVVRPHRDALTGLEATEQSARNALSLLQELGVRPAATRRWLGCTLDERNAVARRGGRFPQNAADGRLEQRRRHISGHIRQAAPRCTDHYVYPPVSRSNDNTW